MARSSNRAHDPVGLPTPAARGRQLNTGDAMPEITGCACGRDHEVMPTDTDYLEDGTEFTYELVCREHKRHEPCRRCLRAEGFYDN